MSEKKFKVGQTLFWVGRDKAEVTITKVGRKWLTLSNERRIDIVTLKQEGGYYGRCYLSAGEYEAGIERNHAWLKLRRQVGMFHTTPAHLTTEQVQQVSRLLFPES
ncbi:hypothetical protein Daci_3425 [Delftia acidovorans SPH-1]|uniref:Uncharacterized protein n=1 Tax=Delftia acidovorans (strain DSM 14801 / SPH-1) TaxID=398578 RepID=A9C2B9_DELAS|nr:hypothetical protein [Delftia acidovorans]ABX36063.1 hypothetical protein Daci_3425 [Delftia acidovorans SPH-1]QPS74655.1 hypothetical protein I6G48_29300 [Delftia acidovorans]